MNILNIINGVVTVDKVKLTDNVTNDMKAMSLALKNKLDLHLNLDEYIEENMKRLVREYPSSFKNFLDALDVVWGEDDFLEKDFENLGLRSSDYDLSSLQHDFVINHFGL